MIKVRAGQLWRDKKQSRDVVVLSVDEEGNSVWYRNIWFTGSWSEKKGKKLRYRRKRSDQRLDRFTERFTFIAD